MNQSFINKKKLLQKMFSPFSSDITIDGIDNLPQDGVNIYIANHCSIMDVFLISSFLEKPAVSIVSATTLFGLYKDRKKVFEDLLYSFPMEVRAGKHYTDICMQEIENLLINGVSVIIFPQGVFDDGKSIARARTGLARIVFDCMDRGLEVNIIPIALDISNIREDNILSTDVWNDFSAHVQILPRFQYLEYYNQYIKANTREERNIVFHELMDFLMASLANHLHLPFVSQYNHLYDMDGFWVPNEKFIPFEKSNDPVLHEQYYDYVHSLMIKYLELLTDDISKIKLLNNSQNKI